MSTRKTPSRLAQDVDPDYVRELLRLCSIRLINDYVEMFHAFSRGTNDVRELERAFEHYRDAILVQLQLRVLDDKHRLEADILRLDGDGSLSHLDAQTNVMNKYHVPEMGLRTDTRGRYRKPRVGDGVAAFAAWAGINRRPGVCVAEDVRNSSAASYFDEVSSMEGGLGWYKRTDIGDMYKPSPSGNQTPYGSILSTAIMCAKSASSDPGKNPEMTCVGVLNVDVSVPMLFTPSDCAWARTCASLIGSMYESFARRRDELSVLSIGTTAGLSDDAVRPNSGHAVTLEGVNVLGVSGLVSQETVFITYSHDSIQHEKRVQELASRLRVEGLTCTIDMYHPNPPEGWTRFMTRHITQARHVLVVCSETYRRRFDGEESCPVGFGADWEGILVLQQLYEAKSINDRFIPVFFDGSAEGDIPLALKPYTRYRLMLDYDGLYRHLTNQPRIVPKPLGRIRERPPESSD